MNARKMLFATVVAVMFISLLTNQASASASIAFAPYWWGTGSWPGGYIPYTFVGGGGAAWVGAAAAGVIPATGVNREAAGPGFGYAVTWVRTGWWWYVGPAPQVGRVHLNTWLGDAGITAGGWVRVRLLMIQLAPLEVWMRTIWFRVIPGAFEAVADGGISRVDIGFFGTRFQWSTFSIYQTWAIIDILNTAAAGPTMVGYSRYDEIMWIADQLSPEEELTPYPRSAIIVDPPIGPVCNPLVLNVNGTKFAPSSLVYVYYDGVFVAKTLTDGLGNFITSFGIHETEKRVHIIKAIDSLENSAETVFISVGTEPPIHDINGDGKVDIKDVALVAKDFGKTEDPPLGPATISVASMAVTAILAIPLTMYQVRKKKEKQTNK